MFRQTSPSSPNQVILRFKDTRSYQDQHVFEAQIVTSPIPLNGGPFRFDVEREYEEVSKRFQNLVELIGDFYRYDPSPNKQLSSPEEIKPIEQREQEMRQLGWQLYQMLPLSLQEEFPRLLQTIFQKQESLHLIIEAHAKQRAARLLTLPWELLMMQEELSYLAYSPRFMIERRVLGAISKSAPMPLERYHLLHVIAEDLNRPERSRTQFQQCYEMERVSIPKALPSGYACIEAPGSVRHMRRALNQKTYHIFHFLGHGVLQNAKPKWVPRFYPKRGYLLFINADGQKEKVTGEQLQRYLVATMSDIQLAVLNACDSASAAAGSVALELIASGLPAVVAMQGKIRMPAARIFTESFYKALTDGHSYEKAVALGRAQIAQELPGADWCLPVLYTNAGLRRRSIIIELIERTWQWFSQNGSYLLPRASVVLGLVLLMAALFLQFNGMVPPIPNISFLTQLHIWAIALPFLFASWIYLAQRLELPADWSRSTHVALLFRLLAAASLGLGFSFFAILWVSLLVLFSLGIWTLLPPILQFLWLALMLLISLTVSYSQTVGFNRAFLNSARVEIPSIEWGDLTVALAGLLLMFIPLAVWNLWPRLLVSPLGALIVGILLLGVGVASVAGEEK